MQATLGNHPRALDVLYELIRALTGIKITWKDRIHSTLGKMDGFSFVSQNVFKPKHQLCLKVEMNVVSSWKDPMADTTIGRLGRRSFKFGNGSMWYLCLLNGLQIQILIVNELRWTLGSWIWCHLMTWVLLWISCFIVPSMATLQLARLIPAVANNALMGVYLLVDLICNFQQFEQHIL